MQLIRLNSIELLVRQVGSDVRLIYADRNVLLMNQSVAIVADILVKNFKQVSEHYKKRNQGGIANEDLDYISTQLVSKYFYMYNSWNNWYKKIKKRDLLFQNEDFSYPDTYDDIIYYLRNKYPDTWLEKCALLLDMTTIQLQEYYTKRLVYYHK